MSKKRQHSLASVLSIDPYSNSYAGSQANLLEPIENPLYDKNWYNISYLSTKNFIVTQVSLSKNIPDDDIYDAIYSKAYDELGLDQAIEYSIEYTEVHNRKDNTLRVFNIFVVEPQSLETAFGNALGKIKYIDYITPLPLLYKPLYTRDIISDSQVEAFIYIERNDASFTLYRQSEFIYTKSLNHSLAELHERFCELIGENISYGSFVAMIRDENLKHSQNPHKLELLKLYKEMFASVSDILTYAKRAFDIEKINKIYIDFEIQAASRLDEICEVELGIKSSSLEFEYSFFKSSSFISPIHTLMHLFTITRESERYECNFSIFHRPPKFIKRESAKALFLVAASLLLAFLYPLSYYALSYAQSMQYNMLQNEYNDLHGQRIIREAEIKTKTDEKLAINKKLNEELAEYDEKKNTLVKIHDVKVNYPMKASFVNTLSKELAKHNIKVGALNYTEDGESKSKKELALELVSKSNINITKLLEDLTKSYEGQFSFALEKISFETNQQLYFSQLKVSLL